MRPVCCNCNQEMVCKQNGTLVRIAPCSYISGDRYECPGCGARIVTGFAKESFSSEQEPHSRILSADLTEECRQPTSCGCACKQCEQDGRDATWDGIGNVPYNIE